MTLLIRRLQPLGAVILLFVLGGMPLPAPAAERAVGDLDNDGVFSVMDLARQIAHMRGQQSLSEAEAVYADVNRDGVFNDYDSEALVRLILGTDQPSTLPLARILESSPTAGESGVALTREFVLRFTMPLGLGTALTTHNPNTNTSGNLYAEFAGKKLLTRVEFSSDRRKATLFFLEPLPASARVRVTFNSTGVLDLLGRVVDGNNDGVAGGTSTYDFDTLSISALGTVGIVGTVYGVQVGTTGSTRTPLAGVTISVDGAEQTLRTTTGPDGKFLLSPAPAGRFFVLIDGRTAAGSGSTGYYAFVGKAWEGVPGRLDTPATAATGANAAGDIYLPFIPAGTLQTVSATTDTPITFSPAVLSANPGLAGVQITVPANSLFADNGARGGRVGIAPVAPDKLPEPLPPGLQFPLVITIQTDGAANFDRPVPLRFPNLNHPVTGEKLAAGSKSALWSFDHDIGRWEVVGPMTVSLDGNFVETDPGVGVKQPGWHGQQPGAGGNGPPPTEPPPDPPKCPDRSAFEWAELIYDIGADAVDCASNFSKIASGINCATTLISSTKTIIQQVATLEEMARTGASKEAIRAAYEVVKAEYEKAKGLIECFKAFAPAEKAAAAFNCLGNILNIAASVCDFAGVPPTTPIECQPPAWARTACTGVQVAQLLHAEAKSYVDLLENLEESLAVAAIELAFSKIDLILGISDLSTQQLKSGPARAALVQGSAETLTFAELQELATLLMTARGDFEKMSGGASGLSRIPQETAKLENAILGLGATISTSITANGVPFAGRFYYLVEVNGSLIRGSGNAGANVPLILPANSYYSYSIYDPERRRHGKITGRTGANGSTFRIGAVILRSFAGRDTDGDELDDHAEFIIGTAANVVDTDDDGISDGAEVRNGANPLDGIPAITGVIASVDTPGNAQDIVAGSGVAAVADGTTGVILFNVANALSPLRVAQVDTPGSASAIAFGTRLLAVADGNAGLAVVDVNDSPKATILHQVSFGTSVNAVATNATLAYVGLADGAVATVDLPSGVVLQRKKLSSVAIQDVVLGNEALYAYALGQIYTVDLREGDLGTVTMIAAPGNVGAGGRRLRLAFAGDRLYATHTSGVNVFSLTNPFAPTLLRANNTTQFGWKQFVPNGSGLAVAAVDPNSTNDGAHDISLYQIQADGSFTFLTTIPTPGLASAVAIYNGLAYVADGAAGFQVVNYLAYDSRKQAPTIALNASFPLSGTLQVEEGKVARLTATVTDDVQARNVEFLIDGAVASSDGGFPFELRFTTPNRTAVKTAFTVQARAFDTGGNKAETPIYTVQLVPDATPPRVKSANPADGSIVGKINTLLVQFSEPLNQATVTSANIQLRSLGADRIEGTADDLVMAPTIFSWRETTNTAVLGFDTVLVPALYRLNVGTGITDLAGNHLAASATSSFVVFSHADRDRDGVPDDLEALLGLDPDNPDTDGDGILDGSEDFDNDGLSNAGEVLLESDPAKVDTNGNGIKDGDEDPDLDGLSNSREVSLGTDPLKADTDGDGWNDEAEVAGGSDPLSPSSRPRLMFVGAPTIAVAVPSTAGATSIPIPFGAYIAYPEVSIALPTIVGEPIASGSFVAAPPLAIVLPSTSGVISEGIAGGSFIARPPVSIALPAANGVSTSETIGYGTYLGRPPTSIEHP